MPDHLHVVAPGEAVALHRRLVAVLSGARRSAHGLSIRFEPAPPPEPVRDRKRLARDIRYVVLNPCRAGLACDPLAWTWSTHRDVVGAIVDPWVTPERLARELAMAEEGFAARYHAYVSGDPSVAVEGTAFPVPAAPTRLAYLPVARLVSAAAASHRRDPDDVRVRSRVRRTFIELAVGCGWRDPEVLADATCLTPDGVRWRMRRAGEAPAAAWLCAGDERLCGTRTRAEAARAEAARHPGGMGHAAGWRTRNDWGPDDDLALAQTRDQRAMWGPSPLDLASGRARGSLPDAGA
jgi:hypothetical protein